MIETVSNLKIFFGHQSVGENILEGIENISSSIEIKETNSLPTLNSFFAHSRVGENRHPESKINGFSNLMKNEFGNSVDFAFLKFCYIDINPNTDVITLFDRYREVINELTMLFPDTVFIHITIPLTTIKTGIKPFIKKIFGRPVSGIEDNIKRQEYNELLRAEYGDDELIFDLAEIESTKTDGSRISHEKDGKIFFSLFPEYTTDGGHLNALGMKVVSQKLIQFLFSLSTK